MNCHICKKRKESLKYTSGRLVCRSCYAFQEFTYRLDSYRFPSWYLKLVYFMGGFLAVKRDDSLKRDAGRINQDFESRRNSSFWARSTLNFKYYYKNGGNVSAARVAEHKRRYLVPDGNGEVCVKNELGKMTDKRAVNY